MDKDNESLNPEGESKNGLTALPIQSPDEQNTKNVNEQFNVWYVQLSWTWLIGPLAR